MAPSSQYNSQSGCAIVVDKSVGKYKSEVVTDDLDTAAMAAIPRDAPHRNVDLEVLRAHEEGVHYAPIHTTSD